MPESEESKEPEENEDEEVARENGPANRPSPVLIVIAAAVVLILIIGAIYFIFVSGSELESLAVGNINDRSDHIEFDIYATPSGIGDYTGDITVEIYFEDKEEPLYTNKVRINDGTGFEQVSYEDFIWDNGEYFFIAKGDGKESTNSRIFHNVVTSIQVEWVGIQPGSDSSTPDYYVDASISYKFGERNRPSSSFPQGYSFSGNISDPDGNYVSLSSELLSIQKRIEHNTKGTYTLSGSIINTFCKVDSPHRTVEIDTNNRFEYDASPFSAAGENIAATLSEGEAVVSFDGSGSWDDGSIDQYEWDFGDGSSPETTSQPTIQHTYTLADEYYVTLTIRDDSDQTSMNGKTSTMVVIVTES